MLRQLHCDRVVDDLIPTSTNLPYWDDDKPLEYVIAPRTGWVVSPDIFLHLQLQLRKRNLLTGAVVPLELGDRAAIINFPASSIWRSAEIFVNQTLISSQNSSQMYFNYLRALWEFPAEVRPTILAQTALWYPDAPSHFDSHDALLNSGFQRRSVPFVDDHIVELYAPIMFDIFRQPNPFPDDIAIQMRLHRNNIRICVNGVPEANHTFELGIHKADLCITRYHLIDRYRPPGGELYFPVRYADSRYFVLPQGNASIGLDIFDGLMPSHVIILQIAQDAFNGAFARNALNLQTNHLKQAQLIVNGTILPPQGYQLETTINDDPNNPNAVWFPARYMKTYVEVLRACGLSPLPVAPSIDIGAFVNGSFLLAWDLRPDRKTPIDTRHHKEHGKIRFIAELHRPLAEPTVLLCLFITDRTVISRAIGTVAIV